MKKVLKPILIIFRRSRIPLCGIIFLSPLIYWYSQKEIFKRVYNPQFFADLYSQSQYVKGEGSKRGLGDDGLYAFAGYYYTFQKGDVSAVNFEHPPLGKYLIGVSILFFKNERAVNIIYFLLLLLTVYKLSRFVIKDKIRQLIPVFLVSADPLFLDHTSYSLLDLPFSLFFVLGVYFFVTCREKKLNLFASQFFWAAAFSTRFFPMLIILEFLMFVLIYKSDRKQVRNFFFSLIIIPLFYLLIHYSFFLYHPSLLEFIRHKKWMLSWFSGTKVTVGNILRAAFTGFYLDSTGHLVRNNYWSIFQPLTILLSLSLIPPLGGKKFPNENFGSFSLFAFCLVYFLYVFFATPGLTKFLMPIYPVMTVLAIHNIPGLYSIIRSWNQARQTS